MIELNLLPKELRKKKKESINIPKIPVLPVSIGVIVIFAFVHLLLSLLVMNNKGLSKSLKSKWNQMHPQRVKTEKIAKEIASLTRKSIAVKRIAKPGLEWSKLLSGLNQAIIPNIWLSNFEPEIHDAKDKTREKSDLPGLLSITGFALGKSEEATSRAAKFINSLKKNEAFSGHFEAIELQVIESHEIAAEEVMMFKLDCRFKMVEPVVVSKTKRELRKPRR